MNSDVTAMNRVPHIVLLYWVIKIASTTLGEPGADMFSITYDLGYGTTTLLFSGLTFVLTRPFGATFGDLLTKTQAQGGSTWEPLAPHYYSQP